MAAIKRPGTRKYLTSEEVMELFSKSRRSVDICSDYSSTTNESELTDIWESSEIDSSDSDFSEGDSIYDDLGGVSDEAQSSKSSFSSESQPEQPRRKLRPRKWPADSAILGRPHEKKRHSSDSYHEGDSLTDYLGSLSVEIGSSDTSSQQAGSCVLENGLLSS